MKIFIRVIMLVSMCVCTTLAFADDEISKEASEEFIRYLSLRDSGNPSYVEVLTQLRSKYPNNLFLQKEWLEVQYRFRRYDDALKVAEEILKNNPRDIDTLVKRADLSERISKKFPEKQYVSILKLDNKHSFSLVRLAEYYIQKKKWQKALQMYYRIYDITGENPEVEHKLVMLNYTIKNYKGIYALHYKKQRNSQNTQLIWDIFLELVYTENNIAAVEQLIRSIQFVDDVPTRASLYYMLCMIKAREGTLPIYESYLQKKKILPAGEWQFYFASYYLENTIAEDDERALPLLREALSVTPDNSNAMKYMVQYYIKKSDIQGIREWLSKFKAATKDNSLDITALYLLTQKDDSVAKIFADELSWVDYNERLVSDLLYTVHAAKKYELAYYLGLKIEEARFTEQGPYEFWFAMLQISSSLNNEPVMTRYYEKSVSLKPDEAYLLNYYAFSLLLMNTKIKEAVLLLEKAHALLPDDGAIMDSLGWGYFLQGKIKKANELITKALEKISDDPEILYHKAKLLCHEGKKDEALKYFNLAQQHDKEKRLNYANIEQDILDCTPADR